MASACRRQKTFLWHPHLGLILSLHCRLLPSWHFLMPYPTQTSSLQFLRTHSELNLYLLLDSDLNFYSLTTTNLNHYLHNQTHHFLHDLLLNVPTSLTAQTKALGIVRPSAFTIPSALPTHSWKVPQFLVCSSPEESVSRQLAMRTEAFIPSCPGCGDLQM